MAREETARVVRAQIETLRKEREALIGRRQRLDSEIASVDADIQNLEAVLQPGGGSPRRSRTAPTLASGTADLVCELLAEADMPLHYRTIYERLQDREPRLPQSDDPATALLARYFNDHRLYRTRPAPMRCGSRRPPSALPSTRRGTTARTLAASAPSATRLRTRTTKPARSREFWLACARLFTISTPQTSAVFSLLEPRTGLSPRTIGPAGMAEASARPGLSRTAASLSRRTRALARWRACAGRSSPWSDWTKAGSRSRLSSAQPQPAAPTVAGSRCADSSRGRR